ncbi:MAG TPA: phage holin family protein [Polyangiaceae bacterium]|jgi:hypothetical protein|nr:phage holin family protein [Polyangiaceae bacterium]
MAANIEMDRFAAAIDEPPVGELVREALGDTRELVRLEVALAREDLRTEVGAARTSIVAFATSAALLVSGVTLLLVALVMALPIAGWLSAVIAGAALLLVAGALGLLGWRAMPKRFFGRTRQRLVDDVDQLREHIA